MNSCLVFAGGPSLQGFDFSKVGDLATICANKSIFHVPNPSYFVTVDYTFLRKIDIKQFRSIKTTKVFVADLHFPFLKEQNGQIVDTRFNLVYNLKDFDLIIKSRKAEGIGYGFDDFRTGLNSGYCALQLAVVLGYRRIYLFGFDLCVPPNSDTHYHGGYGESVLKFNAKLDGYLRSFKRGLEELGKKNDIAVWSCSKQSRLNDIIPYRDWEVSRG